MTAPAMEPVAAPAMAAPAATTMMTGSMPLPQPVATNTLPPVPMPTTNAMRGGVTQVKVQSALSRGEGVMIQFNPTTTQTREVGQAVYVAGPTEEVAAGPQVSQVRQEQLVMGEVQQQVVEIPTVQEVQQQVVE